MSIIRAMRYMPEMNLLNSIAVKTSETRREIVVIYCDDCTKPINTVSATAEYKVVQI